MWIVDFVRACFMNFAWRIARTAYDALEDRRPGGGFTAGHYRRARADRAVVARLRSKARDV